MRVTRFQWLSAGFTLSLLAAFILWRGWPLFGLLSALVAGYLCLVSLGVFCPGCGMFGTMLCRRPDAGMRVALTFDDGPDPESTPALLTLLNRKGVEATFFCVGRRAEQYPDIARSIAAQGHLIGNHSYEHGHLTNLYSVKHLRADIAHAGQVIEGITGIRPSLFRPPMGLTNPRVFRVARELNLRVVGWSARGLDTKRESAEVIRRILRDVGPGGIVVLHDGGTNAETLVRTVDTLIDKLRAAGYQQVRLDKLLEGEA